MPGLLNFQLTDATALLSSRRAWVYSATAKDLDADGHPETILTLFNANIPPAPTAFEPIVIESSGRMRLATSDFFPAGAPTVKNSPQTLFPDLDGDGLQDIVFAEGGLDFPPWTGSRIGVALNLGGGKYRDVSSLIPEDQQTTRSVTLTAGDIDGDGRAEIILPDHNDGANTALLRWNGNGLDEQRNWIPSPLWRFPAELRQGVWMVLADFDQDGNQDLLVGANIFQPNIRIVFGAAGGFTAATTASLLELPDGLFEHIPQGSTGPMLQGAEVDPVVVADFNNDGLPDTFAQEARVTIYQPGVFTDTNDPDYERVRAQGGDVRPDTGIQVFINQGSRKFIDVTSASTAQNLGRRFYHNLLPIDMNNDGFLDVVGLYQTKLYARVRWGWGTTLFLNDGTGPSRWWRAHDCWRRSRPHPMGGNGTLGHSCRRW